MGLQPAAAPLLPLCQQVQAWQRQLLQASQLAEWWPHQQVQALPRQLVLAWLHQQVLAWLHQLLPASQLA
jgi:hypothetical protein